MTKVEPIVVDFSELSFPHMDPQLRYFFGTERGFVAVAYGLSPHWKEGPGGKRVYSHTKWEERIYRWPEDRFNIQWDANHIGRADIYICPTLRLEESRKTGASKGRTLWVDLDHADDLPGWLTEVGAGVVESGTEGNRHVYIPLGKDVWLDGAEISTLNKELARQLGGDAKWRDNSLLRLAGTRNYKSPGPEKLGCAVQWRTAPKVRQADAELVRKRLTAPMRRDEGATQQPKGLPARVRKALDRQASPGERSEAHYGLVNACVQARLTLDECLAAVESYGPSVGHFKKNLDRLRTRTEEEFWKIFREGATASDAEEMTKGSRTAEIILAADVDDSKELEWWWPGMIPFGVITVIDGDPGLGKSVMTLDFAARMSRGADFPLGDGKRSERRARGVVVICAEDDLGFTVKPRLRVAKANLDRIAFIKLPRGEDGNVVPLTFPGDTDLVRSSIEQVNAGMVIIDPIMGYMDADTNTGVDSSVRRALMPLKELAEETGCAMLMVRHLNKSTDVKALYRGGGSIAFIGLARSALMVNQNPHNTDQVVVTQAKANLAKRTDLAAVFALEEAVPEGKRNSVPRLKWEASLVRVDIEELAGSQKKSHPAPARDHCWRDMRELFREKNPFPSEEMKKRLVEMGHTLKTIRNTREAHPVEMVKNYENGHIVNWEWRLTMESGEIEDM